TFHVIKNGDSLWLIAKEYYGEPTPENIRKIMEANRMNQIGYLYPGKKITIPL
ncbi:MAG: LysM peptidoglycan-binding domain-containing protein, partial [Candidatus Melainabacteria bacterium]|nr:LysM peptidoglycan-binding domain-containing protein [Candidatus Melainabacteria bacterium]